MKDGHAYVICTTPRSGSWMLCSLLEGTKVAGRPSEFFGPTLGEEFRSNVAQAHALMAGEYLDRIKRYATGANGVFGMKLIANQSRVLMRRVAERQGRPTGSLREALEEGFGVSRYIWLSRENNVAQAISYYRSIVTDLWQVRAEHPFTPPPVPYNRYALERCHQDIVVSDRYWEGFFRTHTDLSPLRLSYEQLVHDYEGETRRVLTHLGLATEASIEPPKTKQLADDISRSFEERFRRESNLSLEATLDPEDLWGTY